MTNQQILEKAIQKAIEGGYSGDRPIYDDTIDSWCVSDGDGGYIFPSVIELIFNHDFAKALWGDPAPTRYDVFPTEDGEYPVHRRYGGQFHLQQMVISEDPIKYLGENI